MQIVPWVVQLPVGRQVPSPQNNPAQHWGLEVHAAPEPKQGVTGGGGGGGGGGGCAAAVSWQIPPVQVPSQHSRVSVQGSPVGAQ